MTDPAVHIRVKLCLPEPPIAPQELMEDAETAAKILRAWELATEAPFDARAEEVDPASIPDVAKVAYEAMSSGVKVSRVLRRVAKLLGIDPYVEADLVAYSRMETAARWGGGPYPAMGVSELEALWFIVSTGAKS